MDDKTNTAGRAQVSRTQMLRQCGRRTRGFGCPANPGREALRRYAVVQHSGDRRRPRWDLFWRRRAIHHRLHLRQGKHSEAAYGKLAITLIEKATNRAVRVSYKPTLQKQIAESAFMRKRGLGIMPDEIPEEEQMELVNLVWDAPEAAVLTVGPVFWYVGEWFPEVMGFMPCAGCGELTAHAYLRVVNDKHVCIPCSGYDR